MKKKLLAVVGLSLVFLAMSGVASAASGNNQDTNVYTLHPEVPVDGLASWYVAPMFLYVKDDRKRQADFGRGGTLRLGKIISQHVNVELALSGAHFGEDPRYWDTFSAGLHGLFFFTRDLPFSTQAHVSPFIDLGVAYQYSRTKNPSAASPSFWYSTDPVFNAGLGTTVRLNDYGFKLRLQAGYRWTIYSDNGREALGEPEAMIGFQIPLSEQKPEPRVLDNDQDGVPNDRDQCPNTPAATQVDASGCALDADGDGVANMSDQCPDTPAGVRVNSSGCALDSDGDGVSHANDLCSNTPAGVPVNEDGCAQDSDNDGVPDAEDQCPNTAAGLQVTKDGCVVEATGTLENVHFATGSAQLTADSRKAMRKEADLLKKVFKRHSEAYATVNGYTDNRGAASFNKQLSKKRAESVRSFLIGLGVAPSRLVAIGHGETNPIASNATAAGRLQNRRVSIAVHKK